VTQVADFDSCRNPRFPDEIQYGRTPATITGPPGILNDAHYVTRAVSYNLGLAIISRECVLLKHENLHLLDQTKALTLTMLTNKPLETIGFA
jgi:hypothetical protein